MQLLHLLTDAWRPALDMDLSLYIGGLQQYPRARRWPDHARIQHQTRATARTTELLV